MSLKIVQPNKGTSSAFSKQKRINTYNFPFTMNPTMSCLYGCRYCYLSKYPFNRHGTLGEKMLYKVDFIPQLQKELARYRGLPQHLKRVQIGPACEVYHPLVMREVVRQMGKRAKDAGLMSNVLRAFLDEQEKHASVWAVHVVTKSNMIEEDIALLRQLHCVQAEVTITTLDEEMKRAWEGTAPSVMARLRTIQTLSRAGIFTRVMAMPLFVKPDHIATLAHQHGSDTPEFHDAVIRERWAVGNEIWTECQRWGARAFKGKGLNYFDPERLAKDDHQVVKGRNEDPNKELLICSGEPLDRTVIARTWEHNGKGKGWADEIRERQVMNFGYTAMPKVAHLDWGDCQ